MHFLVFTFGGLASGVLVVCAVVIGLALMEAPMPSCADGKVTTSAAAEQSYNEKWNSFDAATKRGEAATVTFTEDELTSRGARYLVDNNVPARDLEIHLCSGQGKGQGALKMDILGRTVAAVMTGHVDMAAVPPRLVVDSLQLGQVPEQIAAMAGNRLLEAANILVPASIREVTTTSTAATLKGAK